MEDVCDHYQNNLFRKTRTTTRTALTTTTKDQYWSNHSKTIRRHTLKKIPLIV